MKNLILTLMTVIPFHQANANVSNWQEICGTVFVPRTISRLTNASHQIVNLPRFPGHENMWYKPSGEGKIYEKEEIYERV